MKLMLSMFFDQRKLQELVETNHKAIPSGQNEVTRSHRTRFWIVEQFDYLKLDKFVY